MLKKPKAIIFDWDNTLVNTWPAINEALAYTFKQMNIEPWTLDQTKRNTHKSMRDTFPAIFEDRWEEAAKIYLRYFSDIHLHKLEPLEYAEDLLEFLKNNTDIYIAIISNKTGSKLRKEIDHLQWNNYFKKIIGSMDIKEDKPSPLTVFAALEDSNLEPSHDIWFIGDTIIDIETAYNSGCLPILYGIERNPEEDIFKDYRPAYHFKDHINTIEELKKLF